MSVLLNPPAPESVLAGLSESGLSALGASVLEGFYEPASRGIDAEHAARVLSPRGRDSDHHQQGP